MKEMTPLEELRHSSAHVLATAVLRLFPEAKLDIGPPTETGFYYDFDLEHKFTSEDLEAIETEMKKVAKEKWETTPVWKQQELPPPFFVFFTLFITPNAKAHPLATAQTS